MQPDPPPTDGPMTPFYAALILLRHAHDMRALAVRMWAEQDPRRPLTSFIKRLRARQATRFADKAERMLRELLGPRP